MDELARVSISSAMNSLNTTTGTLPSSIERRQQRYKDQVTRYVTGRNIHSPSDNSSTSKTQESLAGSLILTLTGDIAAASADTGLIILERQKRKSLGWRNAGGTKPLKKP